MSSLAQASSLRGKAQREGMRGGVHWAVVTIDHQSLIDSNSWMTNYNGNMRITL